MLSKFETKSNRVKGVAFHPKRPWVLASLHTGSIQLWDYKMGTLIDKFDEHDGPVRGVAFHPTQPLFASGGDDYKIKVWNWKQRKCLYTLTGHMDYIRTICFHHEFPWILTASDDQTIRIWNWQSRNCINIITGHNHYVMTAFFHPKENLIVSASMDQTVRVWDFSGLAKNHTTAQQPHSHDPHDLQSRIGASLPGSSQPDIFGNPEVLVKHVIEGHDRGVNWASFHPSLPLIVSGADDRQVKLWRYNETRAWEVDTCRGHFNNVSCAIFHPRAEMILSNSEDKTIRVWDMTKRTVLHTFKREHDRFWVLAAHPELNLFAAGHDNGLIVFKLERERPASATVNNSVCYVKDKFVRVFDFASGADNPLLTIKKASNTSPLPIALSYNPTEQSVLLSYAQEGGYYELYNIPRNASNYGQPFDGSSAVQRGNGHCAVFIARNRFAVLDKTNETVFIKDLNNEVTKQFKAVSGVTNLFYAGMKNILLTTPTSVVLYDTELKTIACEIQVSGVRHAIWSNDMSMVALLSKHSIVIANKKLEQLSQIHETIKVKSGAWDDMGIFVYTTLNHIKYALPQGDNGIIKSLEHPMYISYVKDNVIFSLDRDGNVKRIQFDPTEYHFKLALVKKQYDQVMHIIRTSNLIGQSVIAYLQKKGYAEIALFFVKDPKTRFDLALECGNLDIAVETAKTIDRHEVWQELSQAALEQGNHQVVEMCYQKLKLFDKLSFMYMTTGNVDKLKKMLKIAEMRHDPVSKYHNAMLLGDVEEQIKVLREAGQHSLAYLAAATHGLSELAAEILKESGMTTPPALPVGVLLKPPTPILKHQNQNWPVIVSGSATGSLFDVQPTVKTAKSEPAPTEATSAVAGSASGAWGDDIELDLEQSPVDANGVTAGAWGLEADLDGLSIGDAPSSPSGKTSGGGFIMPTPGVQAPEFWCRNSPLAADHIAAGNFESAMALLHRQVGVVNFAPLKPLFLQVYGASKTYHEANANLGSLSHFVYRQSDSDNNKLLPFVSISLAHLSAKLEEGYQMTTAGRFGEVAPLMRSILHQLLLVVVSSKEVDQVQQMISQCREYIVGITMEMHRRELNAESDVKRVAELAAYFTHCAMLPDHVQLSLRSAMAVSYRMKNLGYAGLFAKRLLDMDPVPQVAQQARAIQQRCDRTPTDEVKLDYDPHNPFRVCAANYVPIYQGSACATCPFCQAVYVNSCQGRLCRVCEVAQVGLSATGMKNAL